MTPEEQAARYVSRCPPAISGSGGHRTTFDVVSQVVNGFALDDETALRVLQSWNQTCQPPWSEKELRHKIRDAATVAHQKPRGHKLAKSVSWRYRGEHTAPVATVAPAPRSAPKIPDIPDTAELPPPIPDGTRELLRAAFDPGEGVRIAQARSGEDGRELPKDQGATLTREEWLRMLDTAAGNPNKFLKTSDRNGIFISVNPMRLGGSRDSDVTAFRHVLVEFDEISQVEQWSIIQSSGVPCTAIISSGGKSIHAWVRVDAASRQEYDERVKLVYEHFSDYRPDEKNKNPSRFSRLPNCERGTRRQELLAVGVGAKSWLDWQMRQSAAALGRVKTRRDIRSFVSGDECLLGERWVCRGFGVLLVGPSGVGKSSLNMQMAAHWAVGRPCLGIAPVRPLKSLVVQAENDDGDLAEMLAGVESGMGIEPLTDEDSLLDRNLIFVRDTTHTGYDFIRKLQDVVELHRPDILWLDPILSFVGDDISKQQVIGQFFRNWLAPVLESTGTACFIIHHTGKPPTDKDARKNWHTSDFAYAGLGSSDLTNWARAVMVLRQAEANTFELKLAKRGKRAGVRYQDGSTALGVWIRHAEQGIYWEPAEAPQEQPKERKEPKAKSQTIPERIATANLYSFISDCRQEGEGLREICRRLNDWAAREMKLDIADGTARTAIGKLVENEKLRKENNLYFKGQKA